MKTLRDLDTFARAYVEALYFTDAGPDGEFTAEDELSESALERIAKDCAEFEAKAGDLPDCSRGSGEYSKWQQAAHDFWLTRNGHGCGFWDGDWPEPDASRLTELSKTFGEISAYKGDDGLIYFC